MNFRGEEAWMNGELLACAVSGGRENKVRDAEEGVFVGVIANGLIGFGSCIGPEYGLAFFGVIMRSGEEGPAWAWRRGSEEAVPFGIPFDPASGTPLFGRWAELVGDTCRTREPLDFLVGGVGVVGYSLYGITLGVDLEDSPREPIDAEDEVVDGRDELGRDWDCLESLRYSAYFWPTLVSCARASLRNAHLCSLGHS